MANTTADDAAKPVSPPAAFSGIRRAIRKNRAGYLFLAPWLIGFFCLTLGPTLASLYLSFTDYDLLTPPYFTGLENYEYAFFHDRRLGNALEVTFTYVLWSVPLKLAAALALAMVLDRSVREVMTAPAITATPATKVDEALSLMTRRRIRHLPVMEGEVMCGFISIGDLVKSRIDEAEREAAAMRDYIRTA